MRFASLVAVLSVASACVAGEGRAATQLVDRIVVDTAENSAHAIGKHPFHDKNFQKRIAELNGRRIQEVVNLDQIRKILKPKPFVSKIGLSAVELSDEIIVSALQTGRIVRQEDMRYHLQMSRECILEMQEGSVVLGVYYKPVGYIRFSNGESYWFLFGTDTDAEQPPAGDVLKAAPEE
jgi:hypothetical protein